MYQNPFNPFDESTARQPFSPFSPNSSEQQRFLPMPPPPPGGNSSMPIGPSQGGSTPMPMGPPPAFSPQMQLSGSRSQQGSSGIRRCIYRNTFIWQRSGDSFWFFPTFVTRNVVLGFRWGRFGWIYSSVNRNSILTYQCF